MLKSSAKNSQTDEQLVADFRQSGNMACIEILFNRYCQLIFGVALKYLHNQAESKDAVVDIFEKVPVDLNKYDIKNFSHWIYIVTKNHCFHLLKKRRHDVPAEKLDFIPGHFIEPRDAEEIELDKQLMDHLQESLLTLNDAQQICVRMFYLEQKSYDEIQQVTGYNYNQVKSHIQNGKRNLKIYLSRFLES